MLSVYFSPPLMFLKTDCLFFRAPQAPRAHLAYLGVQANRERMFSWDPLDLLERTELPVNLGPR